MFQKWIMQICALNIFVKILPELSVQVCRGMEWSDLCVMMVMIGGNEFQCWMMMEIRGLEPVELRRNQNFHHHRGIVADFRIRDS